ncbi:MAG: hypothetical protein LBT04_06810 [Prevotellaceae bacterium]|nr:hypothetical protein [Prevotellaceae bacterium]
MEFFIKDNSAVVNTISKNGNNCTVTFKDAVITSATGKTKNNPIKTVLYVNFKYSGTTYKYSVEIVIQDAGCGCPAKVSGSTWQMFTCHNAGAYPTKNPVTASVSDLHGNYYRWGYKIHAQNGNGTANSSDYFSSDPVVWHATQDPCPRGWRVPSHTKFQSIFSNNTWRNNPSGHT